MGLEELVAKTDEEYIDLVVKLAKDQPYRNSIREKITKFRDCLYEDVEPIRAIEHFLIQKCRPRREELASD